MSDAPEPLVTAHDLEFERLLDEEDLIDALHKGSNALRKIHELIEENRAKWSRDGCHGTPLGMSEREFFELQILLADLGRQRGVIQQEYERTLKGWAKVRVKLRRIFVPH